MCKGVGTSSSRISKAPFERRRAVRNTEFWLNTEGASSWFRDQLAICFSLLPGAGGGWSIWIVYFVLRWMGIRAFYLNETFGADRLIATPGFVQVRRIVNEANWAFCRILVEISLDGLSVYKRVFG